MPLNGIASPGNNYGNLTSKMQLGYKHSTTHTRIGYQRYDSHWETNDFKHPGYVMSKCEMLYILYLN